MAAKPKFSLLDFVKAQATPEMRREAAWRERLGDQGSISTAKPNWGEKLENVVAGGLRKVGVENRRANRTAGRAAGFLNNLTPVGDAATLGDAKDDFQRGNYMSAAGKALLGAVGTIPGVGDAAAATGKAMFLGIKAKNADLGALKRAQGMTGSRDDVWRETGWGKGVDDQWRFEIPDNNIYLDRAKIDPNIAAKRGVDGYMKKHYGVDDFLTLKPGTPKRNEANSLYVGFKANEVKKTQLFEDVAQHPELLEAYPSFKGIGVGAETEPGLNGSWYEDAGTLRVSPGLDHAGVNSTAAHELQHAVQGVEGFARGGFPGSVNQETSVAIRKLNGQMSDLAEQMDRFPKGDEREAIRSQIREIMDKRDALVPLAQLDPREAYRRLAGEVEARNVQSRLWFSPEQRRSTPPWATQDYPDAEQIVRFK